jgi:hypothetical protein
MFEGLIAMIIMGAMVIAGIIFGGEGDEPMSSDIVASVSIPPMPNYAPDVSPNVEAQEWAMYWHEAYEEYADEFLAHFNAIEFKRAKNGASMVRRPGDKSFRFVKKG